MALHILKCNECGAYTLDSVCKCQGKAVSTKPPKYSPDDKYGSYRRKFMREAY